MAIFTDLGALGAAFLGLIVVLAAVPVLRRMIAPGPMFNPEGFARLLVAEILVHHGDAVKQARADLSVYQTLKSEIDRSRAIFLTRFPADGRVYDDAVVKYLGGLEVSSRTK